MSNRTDGGMILAAICCTFMASLLLIGTIWTLAAWLFMGGR